MSPKAESLILYVESIEASCAFYTGALGREPVLRLPKYAQFDLGGGFSLGLWYGPDAVPKPKCAGGGAELTFSFDKDDDVDALHAEWSAKGFPILQQPEKTDFAYTFTAADPDGHRLRAMAMI